MQSTNLYIRYFIITFLFLIFILVCPELLETFINTKIVSCEFLVHIGNQYLPPHTVNQAIKFYIQFRKYYLNNITAVKEANELGVFTDLELLEKLAPDHKFIIENYIKRLTDFENFSHQNGITIDQFIDWVDKNDWIHS